MEFLFRAAVMLLFAAFLSMRASGESQQLAIVKIVDGTDLSKVTSLLIVTPTDAATGRAVITIDPIEITLLRSIKGALDVNPASRATLELSKETLDLRVPIELLGGVVVQRYKNPPLLSVVDPTDRFTELRSLPGVTRVRKPKSITPSRQQ
jgi:hypothetical protein